LLEGHESIKKEVGGAVAPVKLKLKKLQPGKKIRIAKNLDPT